MTDSADITLRRLLDRLLIRVYGDDSTRIRALGYLFLGAREAMRLGDTQAGELYMRLLRSLRETGMLTEAEFRRFETEHRQGRDTALVMHGRRDRPWQEWDTVILPSGSGELDDEWE